MNWYPGVNWSTTTIKTGTRVVTKINGHRDKRSSEFFKYKLWWWTNSRPGTNSRPPLNLSKTITVKQYITNVYDQFDDYL